jgi:hypothetical protein
MNPELDFSVRKNMFAYCDNADRYKLESEDGHTLMLTRHDSSLNSLLWRIANMISLQNPKIVYAENGETTLFQILDSVLAENDLRKKIKKSRSQQAYKCKRAMCDINYVL